MMEFSWWEIKSWFTDVDYTVVGSGIVGLNCALELKERFPKSKIIILERGLLPNGASTKNAGFACFGSISEILDDLMTHGEDEVVELVKKRLKGLEFLRKNIGDKNLDYRPYGGYEIFAKGEKKTLEKCREEKERINTLLFPCFNNEVFSIVPNSFGFREVEEELFFNRFEGQINTGEMMTALLKKAQSKGIRILNNTKLEAFSDERNSVKLKTGYHEFETRKLLIATNGFASQLGIPQVKPARAQVLITKPIGDLHLKGTFHFDKGYYYFRNIENRILLGGGRNLDPTGEETMEIAQTELIQGKLEELLRTTVLPGTELEIDHRWSGIMGVGDRKIPVIKQISDNVFCGVRLGGMGVALGSFVGKDLAGLL